MSTGELTRPSILQRGVAPTATISTEDRIDKNIVSISLSTSMAFLPAVVFDGNRKER